ncbi:ubiquinol-cytochrome c reductase iron-sulfur subunit [Amycolatopsis alba]|uniref:2Fe-2S ferredoxin n=1 Tax=Amycolatopsis alba DSM 44262 TaxID=1125972 RepID=A0A229S853_AMYAL|nr:Rieske 2Fe-2S domain-containing protein [Amycolatopsis alba]OXM54931.1 2Fe-2S ferredoxin [Amycolatopsis alba DSM 44262]
MSAARKFVEDMLARRRVRRAKITEDDAADIRTAILLNSARSGGDRPDEEFVASLSARLAAEADGKPRVDTRRRFVQTTSVAAAAAAVGATVDHLLQTSPSLPEATIVPHDGQWRAVVSSTELAEGAVRPFDFGTVAGFVQRAGGEVHAVSGICTHLGCRLALDVATLRLNCPCHRTAFTVDGAVVFHQLPVAPPPLPRLEVRENSGNVEVLVPQRPV